MIKKGLSCILCLLSVSCLSACSSNNIFYNDDFYKKDGELTISPYFAYYNKGQKIKELEKIDPEIANSNLPDDGKFCIYLAINNATKYAKKITTVYIDYIRDKNENDIVDAAAFDFDSDMYIAPGEYRLVPCEFEKEQVLLETRLDTLTCKSYADIEGCVLKGKDPVQSKNCYTMSINEAKFTSTNSLEGKMSIRNNFNSDKTLRELIFSLKTDTGEKMTINPINKELDLTIKSGQVTTFSFVVNQSNLVNKIKEKKKFNTIIVDFNIK